MEEYKEGINIQNLNIPAVKGDRGVGIKDIDIVENGDLIVLLDDGTQNNAGNINKIEKASLVDGQLIIETTGGEIHNAGNVYDDEFIQARIDKFNASVDEKIIEFNNNVTIHNREFNALFDESKEELLETSTHEKEEISQQTERIYQRIDNLENETQEELGKTGNRLELLMNENTYVMTLNLLDRNNRVLSSKQVDLPLETMVINATYKKETKEIELTLKNGEKVSFSVADLVTGLVSTEQLESALKDIEAGGNLSVKYDTFSGVSANLENSAEAYMKSFNLEGVIEQETREGYNLLDMTTLVNPSYINNGITLSKVEEGILVNGTATSTAIFELTTHIKYPEGDYRLSGCPEGGEEATYRLDVFLNKGAEVYVDIGDGVNFHVDNDMTVIARIRINEGTTVNNLLFKPMIVKGTENKEYQSYGRMPSTNFPSEINVLGNRDVLVKVSNGIEEKNYTLNFGNLTLYKNEIPYIENDKVYYNKKWYKYIFTGNENLQLQKPKKTRVMILISDNPNIPLPISVNTDKIEEIYSNITVKGSANSTWDGISGISYRLADTPGFLICLNELQTEQEYRDALNGNYMIYQLAEPIKTEITGELAEQIKDLYKSIRTYEGITNIELQGYGKINGEYLINTPIVESVTEINNMTNSRFNTTEMSIDNELSIESENPVQNKVITSELNKKIGVSEKASLFKEIFNMVYPVGSIFMTTDNTNPGNIFGGSWIAWGMERVPIGVDTSSAFFNEAEKTGGNFGVFIDSENLPKHKHSLTYTKANTSTGSTTLTASQSGLPKHKHKMIKGYYTYDANSTGSTNSIGEGLEFIQASKTETTEVGGVNASEGHSHSLGYSQETIETTNYGGANNTIGQYPLDITPNYITCYMWKRTA